MRDPISMPFRPRRQWRAPAMSLCLCLGPLTGCADGTVRDGLEQAPDQPDRALTSGATEIWLPIVASLPSNNMLAADELSRGGLLDHLLTFSFLSEAQDAACDVTQRRSELQTTAIVGGFSAEFENVTEAHARTLEWVHHPWKNQLALFHTTTNTNMLMDEFGGQFGEFSGVVRGLRDVVSYQGATLSAEFEISLMLDLFQNSWPSWSTAFTDATGQEHGCSGFDLRAGCVEAHAVASAWGVSVSVTEIPPIWFNVTHSSSDTTLARWPTKLLADTSSDLHLRQPDGTPCPAEFPNGSATCIIEVGDDSMSIDDRVHAIGLLPDLLLPNTSTFPHDNQRNYVRAAATYKQALLDACEDECGFDGTCLDACPETIEDGFPASCNAVAPADIWVSIQVSNLSSFDDRVEITYYRPDGSVAATKTLDVAADTSAYQLTYQVPGLEQGFMGSARVRSLEGASISTLANMIGTSRDHAMALGASYEATTSPGRSHHLPLIDSDAGLWSDEETIIAVTNSTDGHVTGEIALEGVDDPETFYLAPHATVHIPASTWWPSSILTVGPRGATVTADGEVSVAALHITPTTMSTYTAAGNGAQRYAPIVNFQPQYDIDTKFYVQNTAANTRDLTVTYPSYAASDGQPCVETVTDVVPGHTVDFGWSFIRGESWWEKIVATRRESTCPELEGEDVYTGPAIALDATATVMEQDAGGLLATVVGSDLSTASNNLVFPNIMDANHGWWTAISVINVGKEPIDITCSFQNSSKLVYGQDIAPSESFLHLQRDELATDDDNDGTKEGYVGSALCWADGPILGTGNALNEDPVKGGMYTYRATN